MTEGLLAALAGDSVQRVLELARRHLGMDVAFLAELTDGRQVYRAIDGDGDSFGWQVSGSLPLPESYCRLMVAGEIPNAIPDTTADETVRALPVTEQAGIGSYVGVPIRLTDGSLYGSFCAVSHDAHRVDDRDARFLAMLAELVAREVEVAREQDADRIRIGQLIDAGLIQIALQPIVDVRSGRTTGFEALTRVPADYGAPDAVFAAAHTAGLGARLERLAGRQAMDLLPLLGDTAYLAINFTPLVAAELARDSALDLTIPFRRLVVEITEHEAIQGYAALRDQLAPARERGLRLAIDDAGAGYASLHHIVELAPDIIKIDRSLVAGASSDNARRSVITAFVALARDIGAAVVAEGVEHLVDFNTVRDLGVNAVQGYLLGRPSTDRGELAAWLGSTLHPPTVQLGSTTVVA